MSKYYTKIDFNKKSNINNIDNIINSYNKLLNKNVLYRFSHLLNNILQYKFDDIISVNLLYYLNNFNIFNKKVLVSSDNIYLLDGLIYYQKYILNIKKLDNITSNIPNKYFNFIKKNKINIYSKNNKYKLIITKNNISLKNLEKNGNIILFTDLLDKKKFNLIFNISKLFENMYIYYEKTVTHKPIILTVIFINFNGKNSIPNNIYNNEYSIYLKYMKNVYLKKIKYLEDNNLTNNFKFSIKYAKDNNLSINDWFDKDKFKKIYKFKSIIDIYNLLSFKSFKLKSNCDIKISVNKKLNQEINLEQLFIKHENFYKNLEKENVDLYKKIENNIKKRQQNLHKILYEKHNININGKVVSRAWIKLYEIYNRTKFFKSFDKVNAFFLCEAPGNFINSTIHYLHNKTKITDFKWMSQSLRGSDIYDTYGFIKKTKDKWDFGKDNLGDITKYENLLYYIEKYKNSDIVVGDCGLAWSDDENINLGYYQLFYNLLIPRKGGNFILKTHATNIDLQFFSLLYIVYCKYEKIYFFRSSVNFYSPEIYIIGKNFKGINSNEENNLLQIFKSKDILYPVNNISDKFIKKYIKYMLEFIRNYKNIKTKFVYFMKNPDVYQKLEKMINKIIDVANKMWIKRNII